MYGRSIVRSGCLALSVAGAISPAAAAAPAQLLNKTILISWSSQVTQRAPDGSVVTPRIDAARTVYVSTAGRLFIRTSRANQKKRLASQGDLAPGDTRNKAGEATSMQFHGNQLVGTVAWAAGAGRLVVSFDSSFASCSMDVIYGRLDGNLQRKGLDGVMYQIQSIQVGSKSCSIRDGNVFAGQ
jgi:hypothetical protein